MDLVKFKRDQEQYRDHVRRVRNIIPVLEFASPLPPTCSFSSHSCSADTPESLGLKHLALRPKKMQLIEDRRQAVAKENAKLMTLMTDVSPCPALLSNASARCP